MLALKATNRSGPSFHHTQWSPWITCVFVPFKSGLCGFGSCDSYRWVYTQEDTAKVPINCKFSSTGALDMIREQKEVSKPARTIQSDEIDMLFCSREILWLISMEFSSTSPLWTIRKQTEPPAMRKTLWLSSDTWGVGKPLRPAQV